CTVQTAVMPSSSSVVEGSEIISLAGGVIQLSGLYEPPAEWITTAPGGLTIMRRLAGERYAFKRPAKVTAHSATTRRITATSLRGISDFVAHRTTPASM